MEDMRNLAEELANKPYASLTEEEKLFLEEYNNITTLREETVLEDETYAVSPTFDPALLAYYDRKTAKTRTTSIDRVRTCEGCGRLVPFEIIDEQGGEQ